jgi:hypothetical protein
MATYSSAMRENLHNPLQQLHNLLLLSAPTG